MKAVGLHHKEHFQNLTIERPVPKGRDLLVEIKAVSMNPVDTKVRASTDPADGPKVFGYDASGIVVETGEGCKLFKPGDEVYYAGDITRPGTNSQYHLVDERIVGHKPKKLSFAESAAMPLTGLTAWEGLFERLMIDMGDQGNTERSILIIGGAGGVGSIAIQLAKLAGLNVIATASREETERWCRNLGADMILNHRHPLKPQLVEQGLNDVDYIFNTSSTEEHWGNMVECIAPQGKICGIVEMKGSLPLDDLQAKSATFVWEFMFTRSSFQTKDMVRQHQLLNHMAYLLDGGQLRTTLTETYEPINAKTIQQAHEKLESGTMIGKLVVEKFE
ncbi:zinc-binding alcohol dehydrogenase family protein [Sporosarcina sp. Marseille-Q4943]|uniref:zinc-binding alcohol dehydrogenase family protein n=1 Tax=Sporosarcina sp. Marseille-Q4943 TaxID=2942204 RepID=UPI00208DA485|nr:zinc-binding alcohol dehydrogenase family protein [Sporosarcina sp. Marseille-Q4943]